MLEDNDLLFSSYDSHRTLDNSNESGSLDADSLNFDEADYGRKLMDLTPEYKYCADPNNPVPAPHLPDILL